MNIILTTQSFCMSTYRQLFYQLVFGTKNYKCTIAGEVQEDLYKYICGLIKNRSCKPYSINGMEDHLHIFSDLHPSICLSNYVKDIKVASSIWLKENNRCPGFEAWQDGYGAFTYSIRE